MNYKLYYQIIESPFFENADMWRVTRRDLLVFDIFFSHDYF